MINKVITCLVALSVLVPISSRADEGMWLPMLLKDQRYAQMRKLGLKLSAEEIYAVNKACLTNAVVGFMGEGANLRSFGTGSFISDEGLVITNYHVVMSYIERFSNPENDFIKNGYWAKSREEESYCRGLSVKQLVRMEDVTHRITAGTEGLMGRERQNKIDVNGKALADQVNTENKSYEVKVQALFGNNQYIMSIYMVYDDVRMVAAPPFSIGKFGGDTDNYEWPRHTGDFAILRVYANKDNKPAHNAKANVPLKPSSFLKIGVNGVGENDFVMALGFPGTTREYIPSFVLDRIINEDNVAKVDIRRDKMNIIKAAIAENPDLKFRYTTTLSSVGNNYLRWSGEIQGVRRMDLVNVKRTEEEQFNKWANATPDRAAQYGTVLQEMDSLYQQVTIYNKADIYFQEAGLSGAEIVPFIGKFEKLVALYKRKQISERDVNSEVKRLVGLTHQFYQNWSYDIDRKVFRNLMFRYYSNVPEQFKSEAMVKYITQYEGDIELLTKEIFENSIFGNKEKVLAFLENKDRDVAKTITQDPLYQIAIGYYMINVDKIARQRGELQFKQIQLYDRYMKGYLEMNAGKVLYPDASASLRVSYGTVKGVKPSDGLIYTPYTTMRGVLDKALNNMGDEQFAMPRRLADMCRKGDYGRYADSNGDLRVNFLFDAHTTGGNSGSPVVNSKGELVGINFDRIWQGAASDYRYQPDISRAIAVDIRYILFLIDKFSPSSEYLMKELKLN